MKEKTESGADAPPASSKADHFVMRESISVVIPSRDGSRKGNVPKLLEDIQRQTTKPDEIRIIKGESPSSRARNIGAGVSTGDIIVFFDDDVRLGNEHVIENMIRPLLSDRSLGITGASQQIPKDANCFQRRYGAQVNRSTSEIVDTITDSDMATTAAMAVRKEVYWKVGGENESLTRGEDPEFRYRIRKAGYRVVVVPHTWIYHPPPEKLSSALKASFMNGMGSARDGFLNPDLVIEVPEGHVKDFVPKRSLLYRALRGTFKLFKAIFSKKEVFVLVLLSYYAGYLYSIISLLIRKAGNKSPMTESINS